MLDMTCGSLLSRKEDNNCRQRINRLREKGCGRKEATIPLEYTRLNRSQGKIFGGSATCSLVASMTGQQENLGPVAETWQFPERPLIGKTQVRHSIFGWVGVTAVKRQLQGFVYR